MMKLIAAAAGNQPSTFFSFGTHTASVIIVEIADFKELTILQCRSWLEIMFSFSVRGLLEGCAKVGLR